ncbi:MAG TPA: hypothetical protein VGO86_08905 [Candidatus Dormibacteraeota bacterium]
MSTEDVPVCVRHTGQVRMSLRTLHSDLLAPEQVLGVYACPECGSERRLPLAIAGKGGSGADERSSSMGAV